MDFVVVEGSGRVSEGLKRVYEIFWRCLMVYNFLFLRLRDSNGTPIKLKRDPKDTQKSLKIAS